MTVAAAASSFRPCRKVRYPSRFTAEIALIEIALFRVGRGERRAYPCTECGTWHLTCWETWPIASQDPTEGGAATTPEEARGTSSTAGDCRRGRNPGDVAARAAGAQLTGQRQDGSSQAPADAQHPAPAHGGRRSPIQGKATPA